MKLDDGVVVIERFLEIERFSGIKHHGTALASVRDQRDLVEAVLSTCGIGIEIVGVVGTPGLETVRNEYLGYWEDASGLPIHTVAHLFTGFCSSPALGPPREDRSELAVLALALDGGPDFAQSRKGIEYDHWFGAGFGVPESLSLWATPSPGPIYAAARRLYGVEEGTLMAFAGVVEVASEAVRRRPRAETVRLTGEESIGYSELYVRQVDDYARSIAAQGLVDANRDIESEFDLMHMAAVMALVQEECTALLCEIVERSLRLCPAEPQHIDLSITGGFGLNCPATQTAMESFGFRSLRSPPWVNDAGQSIGLAIAALAHGSHRTVRRIEVEGPFLGFEASLDLDAEGVRGQVYSPEEFSGRRFALDIRKGPVAWVRGRAEGGPRALGHRSLLADPRNPESKASLNRIKRRQAWRPVAPIVVEENAPEWFDLHRPSPYMLEACDVLPEKRELIPAVVHLDGSARVQTVSKAQDALMWSALNAVDAQFGVPMLCNTSLNDRDEPIVNSVAEAVRFCQRRGISCLYVNGTRLRIRPPKEAEMGPLPRDSSRFELKDSERQTLCEALNPFGLDEEVLRAWYHSDRRSSLDPRNISGATSISRLHKG